MTLYDKTHKCDRVCSVCIAKAHCTKVQTKHCDTCNRRFLSEKCFQNHLTLKMKGKLVCQWGTYAEIVVIWLLQILSMNALRNFVIIVIRNNLQFIFATWFHWNLGSCQTRFCTFSLTRSAQRTFRSMMDPLFIFPISCAKQMCSKSEAVDDTNCDCEQCVKSTHVFWHDLVGKLIDYLRQSRLFADKMYDVSHNSRGYDAQFLLRKFLELRWTPQL